MSMPTEIPHYLDELPGRKRSMDQDVKCERISTFLTVVLTIPLWAVALAMLDTGDALHLAYAGLLILSATGYIVLSIIRERTVLPAPSATRRKKKSEVRM